MGLDREHTIYLKIFRKRERFLQEMVTYFLSHEGKEKRKKDKDEAKNRKIKKRKNKETKRQQQRNIKTKKRMTRAIIKKNKKLSKSLLNSNSKFVCKLQFAILYLSKHQKETKKTLAKIGLKDGPFCLI